MLTSGQEFVPRQVTPTPSFGYLALFLGALRGYREIPVKISTYMFTVLSKLITVVLFSVALMRCSQLAQFAESVDAAVGVKRWTFANGAEFPGSAGSLSAGDDTQKGGGALNFSFTCQSATVCGQYVAALGRLDSPTAVTSQTVLKLWIKMPSDVRLVVRVIDETGQTLQYPVDVATLEDPDPMSGQEVVVPLWIKTPFHWGGTNKGSIDGKVAEVAILAQSRFKRPSHGTLVFANVCLAPLDKRNASISQSLREISPGRGAEFANITARN